jgi:EF hand domain-containing protein
MPLPALIVPVLLAMAAAEDPPITVRAYPWAPFISPMGEPFRGGRDNVAPISRWFGQADRNGDGVLTADEMQADAERFFARLDSDKNGEIDPEEIKTYEWEIAPDVQVNSNWKRPRGQPVPQASADSESGHSFNDGWLRGKGDEHDGYHKDGLQGAARYGLLNIPQPVASADADFNRGVTLNEFRQAAMNRYKLLDTNGLGRITLAELEPHLPNRPEGRRAKPRKNALDPRVGLPLPEGN